MAQRNTDSLTHCLEPPLPPVFLRCESINPPIPFPAHSTITSLELSPSCCEFSDFISCAADPNGFWPSKSSRHRIYRCRLENDGTSPIYAVAVEFRVIFKEALKTKGTSENARVSGAITFSHGREVIIPKVGAHDAFTFYIQNKVGQFADVQAPEYITFEGANSTERLLVKLKQATVDGPVWMSFPPALWLPQDTEQERKAREAEAPDSALTGFDAARVNAALDPQAGATVPPDDEAMLAPVPILISKVQGRKRGPIPHPEDDADVAEIVARVAPDGNWKPKVADVGYALDHGVCTASDPTNCDASDHKKIPLPRGWKKKGYDWLTPPDRAAMVKNIEYRLRTARKKPIAETFS